MDRQARCFTSRPGPATAGGPPAAHAGASGALNCHLFRRAVRRWKLLGDVPTVPMEAPVIIDQPHECASFRRSIYARQPRTRFRWVDAGWRGGQRMMNVPSRRLAVASLEFTGANLAAYRRRLVLPTPAGPSSQQAPQPQLVAAEELEHCNADQEAG